MNSSEILLERKAHVVGYLEELCSTIELTPAQIERIETSYKAVGEHLVDSVSLDGFVPRIFPQGSVRLGTPVRPIHPEQHFDVDLVCKLEAGAKGRDQARIHALVGDALREHGVYNQITSILKRGWRLDYAESSRFHLDVTPAVPNAGCALQSVFVPDKELKVWQPSNPDGYAVWFGKHAAIRPRIAKRMIALANEARGGTIDPLPSQIGLKNVLQRLVQLLKRHRDLLFEKVPDRAPISIIITTLAAKSYAHVALGREYESEFDLLRDVIAGMPNYIGILATSSGGMRFEVPNETVIGENFAEKWNKYPDLAVAFREWHASALGWIDALIAIDGRDNLQKKFRATFGNADTDATFKRLDLRLTTHRKSQTLLYGTPVGLNVVAGHPVRSNTFYGA